MKLLWLLCLLVIDAHSKSPKNSNVQGDMVLLPEQMNDFKSDYANRSKRMAADSALPETKWPRTINFRLKGPYTAKEKYNIRKGLRWFHDYTCLNFVENGKGPEMTFVKEEGCSSGVGFANITSQTINIGGRCDTVPTVVHEVAHALGFQHEQDRFDRDNYVTVHLENLNPNDTNVFDKSTAEGFKDKGYAYPYDYGSIMQYSPDGFAKKPNLLTLTPKNKLYMKTMYRGEIQLMDALAINTHYNCFDNCKNELGCVHAGKINPRTCKECLCPAPYKGRLCELRNMGRAPQVALGTCGKNVVPTTTWNRFVVEVGGKTDAADPDEPFECFWNIAMANIHNHKLQLRIPKVNGDHCTDECHEQGGQIYLEDRADYNPITFCCQSDLQGKVLSSSRTVAVRGFSRSGIVRFSVEYRIVKI